MSSSRSDDEGVAASRRERETPKSASGTGYGALLLQPGRGRGNEAGSGSWRTKRSPFRFAHYDEHKRWFKQRSRLDALKSRQGGARHCLQHGHAPSWECLGGRARGRDSGVQRLAPRLRFVVDHLRRRWGCRRGLGDLRSSLRHAGPGRDSAQLRRLGAKGRFKAFAPAWVENDLVSTARAVGRAHPEARGVIELGGHQSKWIPLGPDGRIESFAINDQCAAGYVDPDSNETMVLNVAKMVDYAQQQWHAA